MKSNTHPKWYPNTKVTCSCGAEFTVGSTVPEITVEICSACHPFFTGEQKFVDTMGRIERFRQKTATASATISKKKRKAKQKTSSQPVITSLKDMIKLQMKTNKPTASAHKPATTKKSASESQ